MQTNCNHKHTNLWDDCWQDLKDFDKEIAEEIAAEKAAAGGGVSKDYVDKAIADAVVSSGSVTPESVKATVSESLGGYAKKEDIPSDYLKEENLALYAKKEDLPTDCVKTADLEGYALKSELPSEYDDTELSGRVAALESVDHSQFLTEHQDLSGYALKSEIAPAYDDTALAARVSALETKEDADTIYDDTDLQTRVAALEAKEDADTVYDDTAVVERIAALESVDHSQFLTEHQSLAEYALKSEIPADYLKAEDVADFVTTDELTAVDTKTEDTSAALAGLTVRFDEFVQKSAETGNLSEAVVADMAKTAAETEVAKLMGVSEGETLDEKLDTIFEIANEINSVDGRVAALETVDHSKYLTEHQDLSEYAKTAEVETKIADAVAAVPVYDDTALAARVEVLESKEDKDTVYDDSAVVERIAALESVDHSQFLTEHQSLEDYALKSELPVAYDDTELTGRVAALEAKEDADTVYDDTAVVERIAALESVDHSKYLTEHQSLAEYAKTADVDAALAGKQKTGDYLEYIDVATEANPGRKAVVLKNHDTILGTKSGSDATYNLVMLSKWDVADFGSAQIHLNLNSVDEVTVNDNKHVLVKEDADLLYATKSEVAAVPVYDDKALVARVAALESVDHSKFITEHQSLDEYAKKSELPAEYDDTAVVERIAALESKEDKDTVYDDTVLTARVAEVETAVETKQDAGNYMTYNLHGERKVVNLNNADIFGSVANTEELEYKYDTSGWISLIQLNKWNVVDLGSPRALFNINIPKNERPTVQEAGQSGPDAHKIAYLEDIHNYDDTALVARVAALESKEDKDTVYDDSSVVARIAAVETEVVGKQDAGNYLTYTVNNENRKVFTLDNADIFGSRANTEELEYKVDVSGWISLIQLNKWNVVDLGSPKTMTNINTPKGVRPTVQEDGQSGPDAHKIAYVDDVDDLIRKLAETESRLAAMSAKFDMLTDKFNALSKTNVEVVSEFVGGDTLNDDTKDYSIATASLTEPCAILGKSVEMKDVAIVPANVMTSATPRSPMSVNANDVNIDGLTVTGEFNTELNSNAVVAVNESEYVEIRDAVFDGTNFYNGIEVGLNSSVGPKHVIFDNCRFMNKFTHNAFSVFRMQDDAVITMSNCYFEDIVGVMRISNYGHNKNVTINITDCVLENDASNIGLILFQDNNKTADEFYANNNFGEGKFTVNITNLVANGVKVTDASLIGAGAKPCAINVYGAKKIGYLPYTEENKKYFPVINFK